MNNINLELYKIFYEVGKEKNITKAANNLYISQPAITQQIKKLETEIGFTLFYRTKYGVEFTKEGEELFNNISNSIISLECAPNSLSKFKEENTAVSFAGSFGSVRLILTDAIPIILKKYPNLNISADMISNEDIIKGLLNNSIDIGLLNTNTLNKENISYKKIIEIDRVFMASKEFVKKNKINSITKENINKYPFIPTGKDSTTRAIFEEFLRKNKISLTPKLDILSYDMRLEYLLQGYGIALFNKPYAKKYLKEEKLVEIKSSIKFPKKYIYLAINKNNINNKFIQNISNLIGELYERSN